MVEEEKSATNIEIEKKNNKVEIKEKTKEKDKIEKPEVKKKHTNKVKHIKRDIAVANGFDIKISPKQSKYVCRVVRGKNPKVAIKRLEDVISEKRPVPMAGLEVGHKKGKGLAGGKFPKNACKAIIEIIKQAVANSVVAEIENPIVAIAKSNRAASPYKKNGRKAKRTHIYIEIRDRLKMMEEKKK